MTIDATWMLLTSISVVGLLLMVLACWHRVESLERRTSALVRQVANLCDLIWSMDARKGERDGD